MPGSSFFALFDDIASLLDDVATMTKVATKKTAGVLGDDLALNAEQVTGVRADRELPVVWAVAKGSAKNKVFLIPAALLISALAPWAVMPLLMLGGAFLCFEGTEKLVHKLLHPKDRHEEEHKKAVANEAVDLVAVEKTKIAGAIRTDFILSAEIIVISLGTVADKPLATRIGVLIAIGLVMTVGVYGLVAGIVKLDDLGVRLARSKGGFGRAMSRAILAGAPWLMRGLSILGTAAMFLVGGGIVAHGIPPVYEGIHSLVHGLPVSGLWEALLQGLFGLAVGIVIVLAVTAIGKLRGSAKNRTH
ncbi:MAG TPA: DUF808 domain-containing protein [Fimbriimonadaceae bacterium]|nr:DUF808 domain-containing protein [Fimbriimonadaceae bacterium]